MIRKEGGRETKERKGNRILFSLSKADTRCESKNMAVRCPGPSERRASACSSVVFSCRSVYFHNNLSGGAACPMARCLQGKLTD